MLITSFRRKYCRKYLRVYFSKFCPNILSTCLQCPVNLYLELNLLFAKMGTVVLFLIVVQKQNKIEQKPRKPANHGVIWRVEWQSDFPFLTLVTILA